MIRSIEYVRLWKDIERAVIRQFSGPILVMGKNAVGRKKCDYSELCYASGAKQKAEMVYSNGRELVTEHTTLADDPA